LRDVSERVLEGVLRRCWRSPLERGRERGGGWGIFFFCFLKRERGWGTLEVKKNLNLTLEAVGEAVGEGFSNEMHLLKKFKKVLIFGKFEIDNYYFLGKNGFHKIC
jgi:hypothetical protein